MLRPLVLIFVFLATVLGAQEPDPVIEGLKERAIVFAQSQADSIGGHYTFRIVQPPTLPILRPGKVSFKASHLSKRDLLGRFFVAFRLMVDGAPAGICRVDLEGKWAGKILRSTAAMPRKAIPSASDLEEVSFEGVPPPGALSALPEGFRLRIPVGAGRTLTQADLEPIPLINAGDTVRVEIANGPLSIVSDAIARSYGPRGDRIRVELPGSKKILHAVVTGPGEARIEWSGNR